MNQGQTRSSLLGIVGAYLLYTAYELFRDRGETDTVMTPAARYAFIALFVLAGAALIVYAVRVWKQAGREEEKKREDAENEDRMK